MIKNLVDYFLPKQEFYLDKISYNRIEKTSKTNEYSLNCTDRIDAQVNDDIVKVTFTRSLVFDPQEIFELSISFGSILKLNDTNKNDYDWSKIDLANEFSENGEFVLTNLISRTSLLIAEITASYGQNPLIIPHRLFNKKTD